MRLRKNSVGFKEEEEMLERNLQKIDEIIKDNSSKIEYNNNEIKKVASNDYEHAEHKRDLLFRNKYLKVENTDFLKLKNNPYFGRMKVSTDYEEHDMYIGEQSFYSLDSKQIVYDWRAPVSGMFYQNQTSFNYKEYKYNLNLKRKITITNKRLTKCYDVFKGGKSNYKVVDEFLKTVLEQKKDNDDFVDIIKSIQYKQNEIIRDELNQNVVVQGVAGSGKTAIILHRLSYLLFNNGDLNPKSFMFIAPTNIFKDELNNLNKKLEIDKIIFFTLPEYYKEKLDTIFFNKTKTKKAPWVNEIVTDYYADSRYFLKKYSNNNYLKVINFYKGIFEKKITDYKKILNFEDFDENQSLKKYLRDIELYSEDKIVNYRKECEHNLVEYIRELKNAVKYSSDKKEISPVLEKTSSSLSTSIVKNKIEKTLTILECKIQEVSKDVKANKESDEHFTTIENKKMLVEEEIRKLRAEINNASKSLEIRASISKQVYLEETFTKTLNKIRKKIITKTISLKRELKSTEKKIEKINSSLIKVFYENRKNTMFIKEKEIKKSLESLKIKSKKVEALEKEYDIHKLFEEYRRYDYLLLKKSNYRVIYSLVTELKKVNEYVAIRNGIISAKKVAIEINECLDALTGFFDNSTTEEFKILQNKEKELKNKYNDMYDKIDKKIDNINKLSNEIVEEIKTINNPSYIWKTYNKYLQKYDRIALDSYYSAKGKKLAKVDAYLILRVSQELGFLNKGNYNYLYIDEAQDYNDSEIRLLYLAEGEPILNLYGDINQRISENVHVRKNWNSLMKSISDNFSYYELKENYRNTVEIVNYCKDKLGIQMNAIGVSASDVIEYKQKSNDDIIDLVLKNKDKKSVVITNNAGFIERLEKIGIRCYTVSQSKGREFTNVIVIDENLSKNEQYVAYTRSLKKLVVFKETDELSSDIVKKIIIKTSGKMHSERKDLNYVFSYWENRNEILDFKEYGKVGNSNNKEIFKKFKTIIKKEFLEKREYENVVLCCPPSHTASKYNDNSIAKLIEELSVDSKYTNGNSLLIRTRTIPSCHSNPKSRDFNLQYDTINLEKPLNVKNQRVILIDDVYTSGSTMQACAKRLVDAGAKEVIYFTLAYTHPKDGL